MAPRELVSRLHQAYAKQLDAAGWFLPTFDSRVQASNGAQPCFFFSRHEVGARVELIRTKLPNSVAEIIKSADLILANRIPILGYGFLDLGPDIDWQRDPVNDKQARRKPWPRIKYLDFDTVGDSKVSWEISRHQFLVTLAKAWLLTGDKRYVRKVEALFYDWQSKNPYPIGINWCSSLEVAFRSISWVWVIELLGNCPHASKLREDIASALGFNAWYVKRYLSTYFSPNTHLLGEAVALFFVGTLCPQFRDSSEWRRLGWKLILDHARSKVRADGGYFEQSTYYHVYALDFFLHSRILAMRNAIPIPVDFDETLKRMLTYLATLCRAGPPPCFGDDDGGRLFDGTRNQAMHLLDPLPTGAAIFGDPTLKVPGSNATEECIWLLGNKHVGTFDVTTVNPAFHSVHFSDTGVFVSCLAPPSSGQLAMDIGPLGGGSGGHGHADALSVTVNLDGAALLIDPGAYNYVGPGKDRSQFRSTACHSTAVVDGASQALPRGAFGWGDWPTVSVKACICNGEFDYVLASHDGFKHLPDPVTHQRLLFGCREGFWFLLDSLTGNAPHVYQIRWQVSPESDILQTESGRCQIGKLGRTLHLHSANSSWDSVLEQTWFSPSYGKKVPALTIVQEKHSNGVETHATVLCTTQASIFHLKQLSLDESSCGSAYEVADQEGSWLLLVGDESGPVGVAGWKSDAQFLCVRRDLSGQPKKAIVIKGAEIAFQGKRLALSNASGRFHVWNAPL